MRHMYQFEVVSLFSRTVRFHLHASQACPALGVLERACWELLTVKESRTGVGSAGEYARILLLRAEENYFSSPILGLMNQEWLKKQGSTSWKGRVSRYKSLLEQFCPQFACFKCSSVDGFLLLQSFFFNAVIHSINIFWASTQDPVLCHACSKEIDNIVLALVEWIVFLKR